MKILYIAQDSEVARISFMENWLLEADVEFTRVEGVRVIKGLPIEQYDEAKRLARFGYGLTSSEIGCFLAHRRCWEIAAKYKVPTLILESDVGPRKINELKMCLHHIPNFVNRFDILRLHGIFENNELMERYLSDFGGGLRVCQPLGDPMGAAAYVITPLAAMRLVDWSSSFYEPVDVFLGGTWRHKLRFRALKPYPMTLVNFESEIGERKRPKQSLTARLKIELARSIDDLKRIAHLPWHFWG